MKVKDKALRELVNVCEPACLKRPCYWPRPDPGMFTPGQGYRSRESGSKGYLCGTREARGCPDEVTSH
ncbi:hypothetical protein [Thiobaca trueperi]|uniref:Uncharacterized protein n=1 Tax=Thiobaca trueperi TaxID=127458 RepID=A0A4R3MZP9_9GAMM|nr:hypothetical protein [Thiobaca trueperi]TCT21181.1 hypothetical protein EDC35_10434 [Thiobaca trueperi]